MADYTIAIQLDSNNAEDKARKIDRQLDQLARPRNIEIRLPSFSGVVNDLKALGDGIATTYKIARNTPIIGNHIRDVEDLGNIAVDTGKKVVGAFGLITKATPGNILAGSFQLASKAADSTVKSVASIGFAVFGVTQSVNLLKGAFGSLFNETVGREIRLQEALLRTKTTLVSTADVAAAGKRITDPYQAILKLSKPVEDSIESIRLRSLEIAGTTSEAIIQVFSIVSSQVGNFGGTLKDAEDLAISFSAALGTLGLSDPYYATQEVRSILTGTIDQNSMLARSIGLTNEDITKAKASAGGLIEFIKQKLSAFTAGQSLAAKSFGGILSNIQEFQQEISRALGKGFLDPVLEGLTKVYERMQLVFKSAFGIADGIGRAGASVLRGVAGGAAAAPVLQGFDQRRQQALFGQAESASVRTFLAIQKTVDNLRPLIANITNQVIIAVLQISKGLSTLAVGFTQFKFEQFKILLKSFADIATLLNNTVIPALSQVLSLYGQILSSSWAQELNRFAVTWSVLEKTGILPVARTLYFLSSIVGTVITTFNTIKGVIGFVTTAFTKLGQAIFTGVTQAVTISTNAVVGFIRAMTLLASVAITSVLIGLKKLSFQLGVFLVDLAEIVQQAYPQFGRLAVAIASVGGAFVRLDQTLEIAKVNFQKFSVDALTSIDKLFLKLSTVEKSITDFGKKTGESLAGVGRSIAGWIGSQILGIIKFYGYMLLLEAAITAVTYVYNKWRQSVDNVAEATRAEIAVKRLSTTYADLGQNATAAAKAARAFEEQIVSTRIDKLSKNIQDIQEQLSKLSKIKGDNSIGGIAQNLLQALDPANFDVRPKLLPNGNQETGIDAQIRTRREQVSKLIEELNRLSKFEEKYKGEEEAKQRAKDDIQVLAKERNQLEKEIGERRKQIAKELTDFEFKERISRIQVEQSIRDIYVQKERNELERRQARESATLSATGKTLAAIFNEYELKVFNIQAESQKKQVELGIKRQELEKEISDYRYALEQDIAKLREKVGDYTKKLVDYEARERIRAAKQVLEYTLQAAAAMAEGYIVTPEDKQGFMDAASSQGVSAERALTLLKLQAGDQLGISVKTPFNQAIALLKEAFPKALDSKQTSNEEFERLANTRSKGLFNQSQLGSFALQNSRSELGTGRFLRLSPTPPPRLNDLSDMAADQGAAINRRRAALESSFASVRTLNELQTQTDLAEVRKALEAQLFKPELWGGGNVNQASEELEKARNKYNLLAEELKYGSGYVDRFVEGIQQVQLSVSNLVKRFNPSIIAKALAAPGDANYAQILEATGKALLSMEEVIPTLQQDIIDNTNNALTQFKNKSKDWPAAVGITFDNIISSIMQALRNNMQVAKVQSVIDAMATTTSFATEANDVRKQTRDMQQTVAYTMQGKSSNDIERLMSLASVDERLNTALKSTSDPKAVADLTSRYQELRKAINDLFSFREESSNPLRQLIVTWNQELGNTKQMITSVASTVQSELATAIETTFTSFLDKTVSIKEAFGNMFKSISKMFLQMVSQMVAKWLILKAIGLAFPGATKADIPALPARALGGSVSGPTLVGERGPELFIPDKVGTIIPNNALGGAAANVVVNVDANGSKVQGDNQQASQLGRVIASAVQQELIRQKRPGGLLA